jgi:nitrogen-specific signal transduction histidine kinase/CheY-like chemotaxis protein
LERLVDERTRELQATQARLAHLQRMEALGQLAGGIAHDFNNVLQGVLGGAGLIERRPADPDSVRRLAHMVSEAAERGAAVTRRLLAFARRADLRAEVIDPVSLLTDMHELLTHTMGAGIGVRVEAPPGLPGLLADKGQLETVLINLAANGRDAMQGKGMLTLAAEAETREESIRSAQTVFLKPGGYVRLSVSDTGSGIPPEVLEHVTEPFFTTKAKDQGTGLGLAMARGFAEQSGGGLHIESTVGRGTTVHLWFPQAKPMPVTAPAEPCEVSPDAQPRACLLVVDDEPLLREIIAQQLEGCGYSAQTAGNAMEALALLDAGEQVDLIISDLSMPGMDGMSLVREAQRRRPRLPAILLTGFASNAAEVAFSGAVSGTFSLLRKPVTDQQLADRVAMLLEGVAVGGAN